MRVALVIFLFLSTTTPTQAQVIINEVFPAPEQGKEWVELYNISNQEIDLSGWLLEDQLSSPSLIAPIEKQVILAQDFLTVELSSAKLNNSADGVVLINSQGETVSQMNYQKSEPGLSWARNNAGVFKLTPPTKNTVNIFPTPTPSPSPSPSPTDNSFHHLITISEFLACPIAGEQEWVKLYNADNQPHSISGWKIRDLSNQTRQLNATLAAKGYQIISWAGSLLNNSGDEFYLENEWGENQQYIQYDACQDNASYINVDQQWVEKTATTAAKKTIEDQIDYPTPTPSGVSATLVTSTPPTPPPPLYLPQQLILNYDLVATPHQNKLITVIDKNLPREALLSVILGGLWLILSSGWKIHEKISQHGSSHKRISTPHHLG